MINNLINLAKTFTIYFIDYGPCFAIESFAFYLKFDIYSQIKYPVEDYKIKVHPDGAWKAMERGKWEYYCISNIEKLIKKGDCILDIGSWHGQYPIFFSYLVGRTGCIHCFEPDPNSMRILKENIEKNEITNAVLNRLCVADNTGTTILRQFKNDSSYNSIMKETTCKSYNEISINTISVDDYCRIHKLSPAGLKIDVEGAEALVIEGARETIERCHPWILLEFHGSRMNEKDRITKWNIIIKMAKRITYLDGCSEMLNFGDDINGPLDEKAFLGSMNVLITF